MDWESLTSFCKYLEQIRFELDKKIIETQNEILKLQDILDGINKIPTNDPHEELHPKNRIQKTRIYRGFEQPIKTQSKSADLYDDYLHYYDCYKRLPPLLRSRPQERFLKRVMDFSRMTPAQMFSRIIPSFNILINQLDKISQYDTSQPNLRYRGLRTIEDTNNLIIQYQKIIDQFDLSRRVDLKQYELKFENQSLKKSKPPPVQKFETIANLTPKQLNTIYSLRGNARRAVMELNIKEKAEASFVPFLKQIENFYDASDDDIISFLQASCRGFKILSQNHKCYATIVKK